VTFKSWNIKDSKNVSRTVYFEYNFCSDNINVLASALLHATEMPESLLFSLVNQLRDTFISILKKSPPVDIPWVYNAPAPFKKVNKTSPSSTSKATSRLPEEGGIKSILATGSGTPTSLVTGTVAANTASLSGKSGPSLVKRTSENGDADIIITPFNESGKICVGFVSSFNYINYLCIISYLTPYYILLATGSIPIADGGRKEATRSMTNILTDKLTTVAGADKPSLYSPLVTFAPGISAQSAEEKLKQLEEQKQV
jgi:hypothetical protein